MTAETASRVLSTIYARHPARQSGRALMRACDASWPDLCDVHDAGLVWASNEAGGTVDRLDRGAGPGSLVFALTRTGAQRAKGVRQ